MDSPLKCLHPQLVYNKYNHHEYYVPCGRCAACLLQKSYHWKFRVEDECKLNKFSIFFTLTYDNLHIPRIPVMYAGDYVSVCDILLSEYPKVIQKSKDDFTTFDDVGVLSKVDIQLFLKRLRININRFSNVPKEQQKIRYFICGEYGPATLRPHYHGIIWTNSEQLCKWLVENLSASWPLCDKNRTDQYISLVEKNAPQYVSAYINCFNYLPLYLQRKEFRPFHLCSKGPAIGFTSTPKVDYIKSVLDGDCCTYRTDSKTRQSVACEIPPYYTFQYFPRCRNYSQLSFVQKFAIYSASFNQARQRVLAFIREHGYCSLDFARKQLIPFQKYFSSRTYCLKISDLMRSTSHLSKAFEYFHERTKLSIHEFIDCIDRLYSHKALVRLKEQLSSVSSLIEQKMHSKIRYLYPLNFIHNSSDSIYDTLTSVYHSHHSICFISLWKRTKEQMKLLFSLGDLQRSLVFGDYDKNFIYEKSLDYITYQGSVNSQFYRLTKFKSLNEKINPQTSGS